MERVVILRNATLGLAIIGIISLLAVNFVPASLEQSVLTSGWPITLNEDSATYLNQSHVRQFHLKQGQTCNVYVSNIHDTNLTEIISVTIRFAKYSEYLDDIENDRAPNQLTGEYFMASTVQYPTSTDYNTYTSISVAEGATVQIEFMGAGDTSPDIIWSLPGDYVVAVWVSNSGTGETATFDLQISVDGQGEMIRTIMTWIGGIALAAAAIIGIAYIILIRKR